MTTSDFIRRWKQAKAIYSEDECATDGETIGAAHLRLFGEPMPELGKFPREDLGDCMVYETQRDRFIVIGPPRSGLTEIRLLNPTKRAMAGLDEGDEAHKEHTQIPGVIQ